MATTVSVIGCVAVSRHTDPIRDQLRLYEVAMRVSGTYAAAGRPSFDVLSTLQAWAGAHQGITAVSLAPRGASVYGDYYDGTNHYTAPDANVVLSGTGNTTVTFQLHSGAANGAAGTEIADGTAVDGIMRFLVRATATRSGVAA